MKKNRGWVIYISCPITLDSLYYHIKNQSFVKLKDWQDYILYHAWSVPQNAMVDDYIFYVVTYGNTKRIDALISELNQYPEEWDAKMREEMLNALNDDRCEYEKYDGKIFRMAHIHKITREKGSSWAEFDYLSFCHLDVKQYNEAIIKPKIDNMFLSYTQTKELVDSILVHPLNKDELYHLNKSISNKNNGKTSVDNHVQAFIANNSFDKSLEEILEDIKYRGYLTVEELLFTDETEWAAPKWCKTGDIVFFMFAKTANATISRLSTEYRANKLKYSKRDQRLIMSALQRGKELYRLYGGAVFAYARVNGDIIYDKPEKDSVNHWHGAIYAPMDRITLLRNPVFIDEFRGFLTITRQGTFTPVLGDSFDKLQKLIIEKNSGCDWFEELIATPIPLNSISDYNWLDYGLEYRRSFFLEDQFRRYYVDYLLKSIGDKKHFYRECGCYKTTGNPPRVDNIILFYGKYLPVEVKLNILSEPNLPKQVQQYCHLVYAELEKGKALIEPNKEMYPDNVLIIDTEKVYLFDYKQNRISEIYKLDKITDKSKLIELRTVIKRELDLCN